MILKIDPEFKAMIPPLSPDERAGLEASIKREGCHTAIHTWNDTIIDGHNRFEICVANNKIFEVFERKFESRCAARIWIIENQLHRRNVTEDVRMDLALLLKSEIQTLAQERMTAGKANPSPKSDKGRTDAAVAKKAGVGKSKLREYEKVKEHGTPELLQAYREKKVSVHAASQAADLPPEKQLEILKNDPGDIGRITREEIAKAERNQPHRELTELFNAAQPAGITKERMEQLGRLYDAISDFSEMPEPAELIKCIASYNAKHLVNLDIAVEWFNKFHATFKEMSEQAREGVV